MKKKRKSVSYAKWGYIFILPFFICFFIFSLIPLVDTIRYSFFEYYRSFSLIPLVDTIRYSFFEYYRSGIKEIGPNFVGMQNYISLLGSDMLKYAGNTLILWIIGFIPQIVVALLLANWFTDIRLKIKGKQFFKVVIYLPNLIMASAFAMLFFDHGICICNAVFRNVLNKRTDQFDPDVSWMDPRANRFPWFCIWNKITGRPDELPDVVW